MIRPLNWEERLAGALREAQADLIDLAVGTEVSAGNVGTPRYWEREALYLEWVKHKSSPPPHYGWRFWLLWPMIGVAITLFVYGTLALLSAWVDLP